LGLGVRVGVRVRVRVRVRVSPPGGWRRWRGWACRVGRAAARSAPALTPIRPRAGTRVGRARVSRGRRASWLGVMLGLGFTVTVGARARARGRVRGRVTVRARVRVRVRVSLSVG